MLEIFLSLVDYQIWCSCVDEVFGFIFRGLFVKVK